MGRVDCFALLVVAVIGAAPAAHAADAERGRLLYEGRCNVCHDTGVHLRASRKAQTFEGIREQVVRWNNELGGAWRREDIDDVTRYLNSRYYFYRCPESLCGAGQAQASQQQR
ncbi:MAG: hypothetical protein WBM28_15485 [Burkholderiales bacterium]